MEHYDQFEWSEREYSLQEFVEKFKKRLPVLIRTSSGFSGYDGSMHEVGAGEMFWIFAIQKQERVVAKEGEDLYVSIPVDYPFKFQQLTSESSLPFGVPLLISDICKTFIPSQRIVFETAPKIVFDVRATAGPNATLPGGKRMGELEMIETYTEKYLLTHSYLKNYVEHGVMGIPVYIPITINVLKGFVNGRETDFKDWTQEVTQYGAGLQNKRIQPCQDILVFSELPPGDYEYINPTMIFRQANKQMASSVDGGTPDQKLAASLSNTNSRLPEKHLLEKENTRLPRDNQPHLTHVTCSSDGPVSCPISTTNFQNYALEKATLSASLPTNPPEISKRSTPSKGNVNATKTSFRQLPVAPKPLTFQAQIAASANECRQVKPNTCIEKDNSCLSKSRGVRYLSSSVAEVWTIPPKVPPRVPDFIKNDIYEESIEIATRNIRAKTNNYQKQNVMFMSLNASKPFSSVGRPLPSLPATAQAPAVQDSIRHNAHTVTPVYLEMSSRTSNEYAKASGMKKSSSLDSLFDENSTHSQDTSSPPTSRYKTIEDIPSDISGLGVSQLCRCLELLGLSSHVTGFRDSTIDGTLLMTLTEDILVSDLSMRSLDAHRLLQFAKHGWRPKLL